MKSTSASRFSLDANVLIYSVDRSAPGKHGRAVEIVDGATRLDCVLTVQALGEFFFLVTRKGVVQPREAASLAENWLDAFPTTSASATALRVAFGEVAGRRLSFWDALFLATAEEAGCKLVLSEDMHDGMRFGELIVRNPFVGPALSADLRELIGLD